MAVQVKHIGDMHIVGSTEVQRNFGTIMDKVLEKYPTLHVERNGTIIFTISAVEDGEGGTVETFGEEDEE